jgi:hypothetical protein
LSRFARSSRVARASPTRFVGPGARVASRQRLDRAIVARAVRGARAGASIPIARAVEPSNRRAVADTTRSDDAGG